MARLLPHSLAAALLMTLASATVRAQAPHPPPADAVAPRGPDVTAELARQGRKAGVVMCYDWVSPSACEDLNVSIFQRIDSGVLHVRTMGEPQRVTDLLNRSIHLDAAAGVPAIEVVATRIVNAIRGDRSAGTHSSTGPTGQPVTVRGGSTTVRHALDDVVRQAPGLVWYVYFTPTGDGGPLDIGLIGPQGSGGGGTVFPPPKGD